MSKREKRIVFVVNELEYKALELMATNEDSQAALLRRLLREEAKKQEVWLIASLIEERKKVVT